jgi:hypothetical protein
MPSRWSKGRLGFYGEGTGDREPRAVRLEFDALLHDADRRVGLDAAALIPRLDAIGAGNLPPDTINADDAETDLFWWVKGKAAVLYTVKRDGRGRVVLAVALRFCRSASAHVKVPDMVVARRRLLELRNG